MVFLLCLSDPSKAEWQRDSRVTVWLLSYGSGEMEPNKHTVAFIALRLVILDISIVVLYDAGGLCTYRNVGMAPAERWPSGAFQRVRWDGLVAINFLVLY